MAARLRAIGGLGSSPLSGLRRFASLRDAPASLPAKGATARLVHNQSFANAGLAIGVHCGHGPAAAGFGQSLGGAVRARDGGARAVRAAVDARGGADGLAPL